MSNILKRAQLSREKAVTAAVKDPKIGFPKHEGIGDVALTPYSVPDPNVHPKTSAAEPNVAEVNEALITCTIHDQEGHRFRVEDPKAILTIEATLLTSKKNKRHVLEVGGTVRGPKGYPVEFDSREIPCEAHKDCK